MTIICVYAGNTNGVGTRAGLRTLRHQGTGRRNQRFTFRNERRVTPCPRQRASNYTLGTTTRAILLRPNDLSRYTRVLLHFQIRRNGHTITRTIWYLFVGKVKIGRNILCPTRLNGVNTCGRTLLYRVLLDGDANGCREYHRSTTGITATSRVIATTVLCVN